MKKQMLVFKVIKGLVV